MEKLQGIFWKGSPFSYAIGHQFEEIFKAQIYYPYLNGKQNPVVIDAGGNIGIFTLYASLFHSKIYTIEPSAEHREIIKHMVDFNELKDVKLYDFALSIKDGDEFLTHYSNKTMHSLYGGLANPETSKNLSETGKEPVKLKRIDTFFKEEKIDHVDLLKLDVEGVEFEIICGEAFANIANKIDVIVTEVHSYAGRNPQQIIDALEGLGFKVSRIQNDAFILVGERSSQVGTKI